MINKIYKLNGIIVPYPTELETGGKLYLHPTDEILCSLGYVIEIQDVDIIPSDKQIQELRTKEYTAKADPLLSAYLAYTELGDLEKAAQMKAEWLRVRQEIAQKYPYTSNIEQTIKINKITQLDINSNKIDVL